MLVTLRGQRINSLLLLCKLLQTSSQHRLLQVIEGFCHPIYILKSLP